ERRLRPRADAPVRAGRHADGNRQPVHDPADGGGLKQLSIRGFFFRKGLFLQGSWTPAPRSFFGPRSLSRAGAFKKRPAQSTKSPMSSPKTRKETKVWVSLMPGMAWSLVSTRSDMA